MAEDMVMRSVYVRPGEDADLRQLAHDFNVTKSDLIRSAIRLKLKEWLADNSGQKLLADVSAGLRETNLQREVRQVKPPKIAAAKTAAPAAKAKRALRSEEHTSELQSLMRISYAVF